MDSVDLEVLRRSAEWLDGGKRVLLVTVVRTGLVAEAAWRAACRA